MSSAATLRMCPLCRSVHREADPCLKSAVTELENALRHVRAAKEIIRWRAPRLWYDLQAVEGQLEARMDILRDEK